MNDDRNGWNSYRDLYENAPGAQQDDSAGQWRGWESAPHARENALDALPDAAAGQTPLALPPSAKDAPPRRHRHTKGHASAPRRHTRRRDARPVRARLYTPDARRVHSAFVQRLLALFSAAAAFWRRLSAKKRAGALVALAVVLCCVLLAPGMLRPRNQEEAVIARGVTIDGVDVSGMTQQEATQLLRRRLDERLAGSMITLTHAGQSWTLDNVALGLGDDLDSVVQQALDFARPQRLFDRIAELFKRKSDTRALSTSVIVSEAVLRTTLAQECGIVDEMVVEGSVAFDPTAVSEQGLFTITAPRTGKTIDMTRLVSDIRSAVYAGGVHQIAVREIAAYPTYTLSELKQSVSCIAEVSLSLDGFDETQRANAAAAVARLNGTQIAAGHNLSFNEIAGPYSGENGYTMVRGGDGAYAAPGVTLAGTLAYRAGLLSGMKVLTRFAPQTPVQYDAVALDAAISDMQDLVLKNDTAYPIYVHAVVRDNALHLSLYGMPLADSASIRLQTQVLSYTEAPAPEEVTDTAGAYNLAPGTYLDLTPSREGCTVQLYRVYLDKFGTETTRELISTDTYAPVAGTRVVPAQ